MTPLTAAILLALASALGYASAALLQERLAATTLPSRFGLLRRPRWWAAAGLQASGAALHVGALTLGPLTVVQPLGVLTLVLAPLLAALVTRRPVSRAAVRGIALVVVGLACVLLLTGSGGGDRPDMLHLWYTAAALGTLLALLTAGAGVLRHTAAALGARARQRAVVGGLLLAVASGTAHGSASFFVKSAAEEGPRGSALTLAGVAALVVVLALGGLALAQASYRGVGLAAPLATTTVTNPVLAATVGVLLLGEGFRFGALGATGALAAAAVAACGLTLLARDSALAHGAADSGPVRVVLHQPSSARRLHRRGAAHPRETELAAAGGRVLLHAAHRAGPRPSTPPRGGS